jgi:hypothetical protein
MLHNEGAISSPCSAKHVAGPPPARPVYPRKRTNCCTATNLGYGPRH